MIGMSSLLVSTFLLSREGAFTPGTSFPNRLKATKLEIAKELGVDPGQVIYLDQPEFRLDMFLTPGENGQVFIEDPDYSNATINALIKSPGLSRVERSALKDKIYANTSGHSSAPSLSKLRAELKPTIDELRGADPGGGRACLAGDRVEGAHDPPHRAQKYAGPDRVERTMP